MAPAWYAPSSCSSAGPSPQPAMSKNVSTAPSRRTYIRDAVVLRTLDVGGDKPLPFLRQAAEANPFLGERGVRLTLHHPDLFLDQLVAMCAVARDYPVSVMFPMVATVSEVIAARQVVDAALAVGGGRPDSLRIGIMIEVPSAALKAASFVPHVDFFSVGTNDLTQYALAAERGNQSVAELADGLDPGVLRLIAALCNDAGSVPVSVCGELAADPLAVPVLLGLGVRSLSVVPPAVALVKQRVREIDLGDARRISTEALACESAVQVRALVSDAWSNLGPQAPAARRRSRCAASSLAATPAGAAGLGDPSAFARSTPASSRSSAARRRAPAAVLRSAAERFRSEAELFRSATVPLRSNAAMYTPNDELSAGGSAATPSSSAGLSPPGAAPRRSRGDRRDRRGPPRRCRSHPRPCHARRRAPPARQRATPR